MGRFLNKGNLDFTSARKDEYVDKSAMIQVINDTLDTPRRCTCVTRCRRFGKSMAAQMLYAYYDKSCDSRHLFEDLAIAKMPSFEENLNKYPTIFIDMSDFATRFKGEKEIVGLIQQTIIKDVGKIYPDIEMEDTYDLMDVLFEVAAHTKERFIMIIDEWDIICRDFENVDGVMDRYVDMLRRMFKGGLSAQVFVGVYMTGILPIKKYNTESALNNFREYSMIDPDVLAPFFGFTPKEVEMLASKYKVGVDDLKMWYDGYAIGDEQSMYNPYSVMLALQRHRCKSYWQSTGSYEKVSTYIQMNFEGLKDDVLDMLAGGSVYVNTTRFTNDMRVVECKDDVLTVLIHLGYLSYDFDTKTCRIPNKEVAEQFQNAVEGTSWAEVTKLLQNSQKLMEATWRCDEEYVARAIEDAHTENVSILSYNDENSMSCVLAIAYIWARNEYVIHRELATGKGYADLVMIPRKKSEKPAIVIELKYNTSVDTAIDQIHLRNYPDKLLDYSGNLLLAGISYDRKEKTHECRIERV